MTKGTLIAASGVVLLANAFSLGLVAYNRSIAQPDTAVLTERELTLPYADPENTALWLEFQWQNAPWTALGADAEALAARERRALESLGFDCSLPLDDPAARAHYRDLLPRTGFVVFEYDGESWRAYADQVAAGALDGFRPERRDMTGPAEVMPPAAAERMRRERLAGSRLIPVDAGPDVRALRERYPDAGRFLIVPAVVRPALEPPTKEAPGRLRFRVVYPMPNVVHVPREHRSALETLARQTRETADRWTPEDRAPRYEVTLAYGRSREPWVTAVRRLPEDRPPASD